MSWREGTEDRQFGEADRTAAVHDAIQVFWKNGLGGTSARMLERELELRGQSVTDVFGTKKALRNEAIDEYLVQVDELLMQPIEQAGAGVAQLQQFVDVHLALIADPMHPGCLLVNLVTETGDSDPFLTAKASTLRQRLTTSVTEALSTLDPDLARRRANQFVTAFFGLCAVARSGAAYDDLQEAAQATKAQIQDWAEATDQ